MNTLAPLLSALMIILALVGPVISTRRSCRSAGIAADRPLRLADVARLLGKVGQLAGIEPGLPVEPLVEQLQPPRVEPLVQLGEELERVGGQDFERSRRPLTARQ